MNPSNASRFRLRALLLMGIAALSVGVWLRLEAHDLWVYNIHMPDTPGTELNCRFTDEDKVEASVDIARILMGFGATVIATTAAAWLFVPAYRPPSIGKRETGEVPDGSLGRGLRTS